MYIQDLLSWEQFNDENLSFFNAIGIDRLCLDIRGMHRVDPSLGPARWGRQDGFL